MKSCSTFWRITKTKIKVIKTWSFWHDQNLLNIFKWGYVFHSYTVWISKVRYFNEVYSNGRNSCLVAENFFSHHIVIFYTTKIFYQKTFNQGQALVFKRPHIQIGKNEYSTINTSIRNAVQNNYMIHFS